MALMFEFMVQPCTMSAHDAWIPIRFHHKTREVLVNIMIIRVWQSFKQQYHDYWLLAGSKALKKS